MRCDADTAFVIVILLTDRGGIYQLFSPGDMPLTLMFANFNSSDVPKLEVNRAVTFSMQISLRKEMETLDEKI